MINYDAKALAFVLCCKGKKNKSYLRNRIASKYQFSDNNIFYLYLNFRHIIQYVHKSKARTGHLGGCSPQKGLAL